LIHVFNKIKQKLYMLINNNKYINYNKKLNQEAEIMMQIKLFDLTLRWGLYVFLFNYTIIKLFLVEK